GVLPALVTGFTLAFARALGEYGSVVFISGNLPFKTEIATLLIMTKLEQYDYAGATAIASVMLVASFVLLLSINALQAWARRRGNAPLQEPDTTSAVLLTITVAVIAVPLNTLFGIAAAWAIARFHFRGKRMLVTLIDLPFAVS